METLAATKQGAILRQFQMDSKEEMMKYLTGDNIKPDVYKNVKNIPDLLQIKAPSLKHLGILYGEVWVIAFLNKLIIEAISFFNIGKNMDDRQVFETSTLIMYNYPSIKIQEIHFIFMEAKKLKYGILYDRLDGAIIFEWFNKYWEERLSVAETLSYQDHISSKERSGDSYTLSLLDREHLLKVKVFENKVKF